MAKTPETPPEPKLDVDGKPVETKKPDAPVVPEKYADFKLPEGVKIDAPILEKATELFKAHGLTQEAAQSFVDFHTAQMKAAAEAPFKAYTDLRAEWQTKTKADPEIGTKLPEVKATVSRAIDNLGDPALATEFRAAMDLTGAGDHPAFIKAFYKLAQLASEGKPVTPKGPSVHGQAAPGARPASAASAMYPNLPT